MRLMTWCVVLGLGFLPHGLVAQDADLIVHNAIVHTMNPAGESAEAVAIAGDRILAVGSNADILALAGPQTQRIDAAGKAVIPGLIDTHVHLDEVGANIGKLQTSDLKTVRQLLDRIAEAASGKAGGEWIVGASDWHESQLEEARFPTRAEIDEVAPDNPVFLQRGGINTVINTAAMKVAGIGEDDPNPPGGKYDRDANGRFTGWIQGFAKVKEISSLLPKPDAALQREQLLTAMRAMSDKGITTVRSMHVRPDLLNTWRAVVADGGQRLRGVLMMSINPRAPLEADLAMLKDNDLVQDQGDDMLRIGGLKATYDGGVETSLLKQDFAAIPGFKGIEVTPIEKVRAVSDYACKNGWRLSIHAIGDQAIANVLGAWNEIDKDCPLKGRRWGLEHPYLPGAEDIETMKRLGIVPHMQVNHNYTLGAGWVQFWGKERADRSIPNRTYIDAGLQPAGGTDAPVTPYDPFLSIWGEITRQTAAAGVLGTAEAVTPQEALMMHTVWAAYSLGMEDRIGSIAKGKYADLAILSGDPLTLDPEKIRAVTAEWTILGGNIVHRP